MVAGTSKRCTIHEYGCPEEPCPHRTHNKKIVMTANLARTNAANTMATRTRAFYREDIKPEMKNIFMSYDDQINCRFEPIAGSLNPYFLSKGLDAKKLGMTAETEAEFKEKHGANFCKTHPEVYKAGVLKKAQGKFRKGEFSVALNTLMTAFKISSLRQNLDPVGFKKLQDKKAAAAKAPKVVAKPKRDDGLEGLEGLKEDPDEAQTKMHNENFDDIKLRPILEEAFALVQQIESRTINAKKEIRNLEKQKKKLKDKQATLAQMTTVEEQVLHTKELFKTIMCPLILSCPNDTRDRWPKSSAKSTTQFGAQCPYAHHAMELQFPQTIQTKISAISKMQTAIRTAVDSQKPQQTFVPTGRISDCKGSCFTSTKCNMCSYKADFKELTSN